MPTPADIRGLAVAERDDRRARQAGRFREKGWYQMVRDASSEEIIGQHAPGKHLSPDDLGKKYGSNIFVSMSRQ